MLFRSTSFGAFIDLGGVDGLVHLTELSHERNVSPKSVVSVGDEIEVKVLDLNEEEGRVSLSLKATTPGPWDGVEQKLTAGNVIEGTVKRLTDFGAFVEVLPGIDGLVHISQISHKRVESPKDALKVGAGQKLFQANCATCHGTNAEGTADGPSLIGVGAAAVDFQVGTGQLRSEERRVGKECRSRWSPYH